MRYTIYDPVRDCEITTPRGLRITDGPETVEWFVSWPEDAIFFRVEDTHHDCVRYCTQIEAVAYTGCSVTYLYNKTIDRNSRRRLYKDRYFIDPIPRRHFIVKTGRKKCMVTAYKYSY